MANFEGLLVGGLGSYHFKADNILSTAKNNDCQVCDESLTDIS
jgi:hypothetical protein